MVWPGDVIADGLGRVAAEKHRAGMFDAGEKRWQIGGGDLQMLGCDFVDECGRVRKLAHDDDGAMVLPRARRDVAAGKDCELAFHFFRHGIGERGIIGDQDRLRRGIVFGLGEQIGGDPGRIVGAVGDDENLGRSGDGIDADAAEDLPGPTILSTGLIVGVP